MLVPFVQLELAGEIGLPAGRYVARQGEAERVLVVQLLGVERPRGRRRRRPHEVDPGDPGAVPLTRVSVAGAERFDRADDARDWLERTTADARSRAAAVRSAIKLVNRALNAQRAAARDPLVQDIGATRALAIRIGYGHGEQIADGLWSEARELPAPKRGRLEGIDPQTRIAEVLGGGDAVHPAETLLQRARLDAEMGREHEARFGLGAAERALAELPAPEDGETGADLRRRIEELRDRLGT